MGDLSSDYALFFAAAQFGFFISQKYIILMHVIINPILMYSINDLKIGVAIQLEGEAYVVVSSQHSKMARGGGIMKTTLKNLVTGATIQRTFQGNEKIKPASVSYSRAQYLYNDGAKYYFMDNSTFEQFELDKEILGNQTDYLIEGAEVDIQNVNNNPTNVKLPPKINLKVVETEPGVRGDTASGGTKPAKLETGKVVQVPLFINKGDKVRVNTETGEYTERAK